MCGILGIVTNDKDVVSKEKLALMVDALKHRGPNGNDSWLSDCNNVGFGHTRLSIIDVSSSGSQPMTSTSGRYTITYNGEIYNYLDLREELIGQGAHFCGSSDTEVLIWALEIWGIDKTIDRLSGMFTIAIWDAERREIYLVRDRMGIKPLYYSIYDNKLVFSSELKPIILEFGGLRAISPEGLNEFLRLGYVPAPLSIFSNVKKLEQGHVLVFSNGELKSINKYWDLNSEAEKGLQNSFKDPNEALDALHRKLKKSVSQHLASDVPIGAFLSGGIDSSTIVSLMSSLGGNCVKTFSVGFEQEEYDEATRAAAVAKHLGTEHTQVYMNNKDALDVVPHLASIYDEPFADPSQIPTFLISKVAQQHVTVALSGDGGDELFCGYNRHIFVAQNWSRIQKLPIFARSMLSKCMTSLSVGNWNRILLQLEKILPNGMVPAQPGDKIYKTASILRARDLQELTHIVTSKWIEPNEILHDQFKEHEVGDLSHFSDPVFHEPELQQSLWDMQTYLPNDILTKVDRASMNVGLEARVPFLDHELVSLSLRMQSPLKIKGGQGKWALRQILKQYVPDDYMKGPKKGFTVPLDEWLRDGLKEWALDLVSSAQIGSDNYFDKNALDKTFDQHFSGVAENGQKIWPVLIFCQWLEQSKSWVGGHSS